MSATDPDGDSQMHSSSSSDDADSEAMFPAELEPPGAVASEQHSGEAERLSTFTPPHSQDPGEAMDTSVINSTFASVDEPTRFGNQNLGNGDWEPQSDFSKSPMDTHYEPGSAWNNKKAREEYQRAWAQIEDKDFSLAEFGDPYDETLEENKKKMANHYRQI